MNYVYQIRDLFLSLSLRQRIALCVAAVTVFGVLFWFRDYRSEQNFKPLFQHLSSEDAGVIVARLKESGVDIRLAENGNTIKVPAERVDELRIQMATAGLPKSGRIGFELFDKANFGTSEFAEQVNYHRAVEGELERSVMSLQEVESARVHITFPRQTLFIESRQPAKASVLVKLKPSATLAKQNILAITHLTAGAVEGLSPDDVSVLDMRGNLLNKPKAPGDSSEEANQSLIEYRQRMERDLLQKVQVTLEPLLGAEKFRAAVSLDCDLSSGDQSEETFDPSRSVMVTSQRSEDGSATAVPNGVPGTPSNLPRPSSRPGSAGAGGLYKRFENTAFQTSRVVRRIKFPQGQIKRVSVSVLLDHITRTDGQGDNAKRVVEPPPPERIRAIKDIVSAAVGFQPDRGDQVIVESLPFEITRNPEIVTTAAPAAPSFPRLQLPQSIPAWIRVPLEGHLNWLIEQKWLPLAVLVLAGGLLFLLYRLSLVIFSKIGVVLGSLKNLRGKKKGKLVDVTIDGAVEGTTTAGQIAGAKPEGAESEAPLSFEEQLQLRLSEQERLNQEALMELGLPEVKARKAEILTRHITEIIKKDSQGVANLVRSWASEEKK